MTNKYDALKLENQLCFPLYAVSKEIDLTYTQYIAMMVLWEHKEISVKDMGAKLFLDSGTLTPLLKILEKKGLVSRNRSKDDERFLMVSATKEGMKLRDKAADIPAKVGGCVDLSQKEAELLYKTLWKLLGQFGEEE